MRLPTKSKSESYSETSDVDEVGIRWKDNTLIRGGLTDVAISCSYENHGAKLAVRSQQKS